MNGNISMHQRDCTIKVIFADLDHIDLDQLLSWNSGASRTRKANLHLHQLTVNASDVTPLNPSFRTQA